MKGQLTDTAETVEVRTECAHCGDTLEIEVESDLTFRTKHSGALVFAPLVNLRKISEPSIIDAL